MNYFVLEITTVNDSTAKAVWEQETLEAAKAQFHSIMAAAYSNPDLTYALCQIIDHRGFCVISERKPTYTEPDGE